MNFRCLPLFISTSLGMTICTQHRVGDNILLIKKLCGNNREKEPPCIYQICFVGFGGNAWDKGHIRPVQALCVFKYGQVSAAAHGTLATVWGSREGLLKNQITCCLLTKNVPAFKIWPDLQSSWLRECTHTWMKKSIFLFSLLLRKKFSPNNSF